MTEARYLLPVERRVPVRLGRSDRPRARSNRSARLVVVAVVAAVVPISCGQPERTGHLSAVGRPSVVAPSPDEPEPDLAPTTDTGPAQTAATSSTSTSSSTPTPSSAATETTVVPAAADTGSVPTPVPDRSAPTGPATGSATGTIVAHAVVEQVVARVAPDDEAEPIEAFRHPTDRGGPMVFQALGPPAEGWIEVLLPVRPNGTTGFVAVDDVELTRNPYRITVDVAGFTLTVLRDDAVVLSTPVAIGVGDTPTPLGDFYLIELLQPPSPSGPYGPYAYGLSGYSETLDSFAGGEGVIGIHGTNRPEFLGTRVSHGCIRVANDVITEMAGFLPLGTPVSIG